MGALGMIAAGIGGQILGDLNDARQVEQNKILLNQQIGANQQMGMFNNQMSKELWDYTNYENQVKHLKSAGLNPALLYGKGGGGGATAAASAGNVSSQNAPSGGNESIAMAGMGMQLEQQKANIELMKSQANLNNVEANKKGGVDTANVTANTNYTQSLTDNAKLDGLIKEVQVRVSQATEEYQVGTAEKEWMKLKHEADIIARQNGMNEEAYGTMLNQIKQNYANSVVEGALKKAQIVNLNADTKATLQNAVSNYIQATASKENAMTNRLNYNVNQQNAETNATNAQTNKGYLTLEQFIKDLPDKEKLYMQLGSQTIGQISNMLKPIGGTNNTYITEGNTIIRK